VDRRRRSRRQSGDPPRRRQRRRAVRGRAVRRRLRGLRGRDPPAGRVYNDLAVEGWSRRERREQRGDCRPRRRSLRAARRAGTRRPRGAAWYESAWAAEGQGKSAFGKLERWAVHTERIGLATGIVNVFSRTPAAIAQAVATLDAHSGGRAVLGLGVAHPGVVEGFHGAEFERPSRGGRVYRTGPPVPPGRPGGVRRGVLRRRRGPRSGRRSRPSARRSRSTTARWGPATSA